LALAIAADLLQEAHGFSPPHGQIWNIFPDAQELQFEPFRNQVMTFLDRLKLPLK
jgi:hypothetical protein